MPIHRFNWRQVAGLMIGLLVIIASAIVYQKLSEPTPIQALIDEKVLLQGKIITPVEQTRNQRGQRVWRFNFRPAKVIWSEVDLGDKDFDDELIRVSWYQDWNQPEKPPQQHQIWQLWLKVKPIWARLNEVGFDYERWAYSQNIHARAYVLSDYLSEHLDQPSLSPIERFRNKLQNYLNADERSFKKVDLKQIGLVKALVLGDRSGLTENQWQVYQATGVAHLLAISGLHIGMAGLFFAWLAGCLWRLSARLCLYLAAPYVQLMAAIVGGGLYALLSGFAVPAERAWLSLMLAGVFLLWRRHVPFMLVFAMVIMLVLVNFRVIFQIGFWLSFSAVLIVILAYQRWLKDDKPEVSQDIASLSGLSQRFRMWLKRFVIVQVCLSIGLMPLTIYGFSMVSWIAPVINLLVLPLVCLLIVPLLLLALISFIAEQLITIYPAQYLFFVADTLLHQLDIFLVGVFNWIGGSWSIAGIDLWQVILAMLAVISLLIIKTGRWQLLAASIFLVSLIPVKAIQPVIDQPIIEQPRARLQVRIFDVSQGLAVWLSSADFNLLYDTGFYGIAQQIIHPTLEHYSIDLNQLIISHQNADHAAGQQYLMQTYPAAVVVDNQDCLGHYHVDGYDFEWFLPSTAEDSLANNNRSCQLRVSYQGQGLLLLTGDIESVAEKQLLGSGRAIQSQVLMVPHHGSKTSSAGKFIDAVGPQLAIVSAGYNNHFKHPSREVLERYKQRKIRLLTTACSGAISLEFEAADLVELRQFRKDYKRLWRKQCDS